MDPLEARSYGALIGATFSENTATIAAESHGVSVGQWSSRELSEWLGICGSRLPDLLVRNLSLTLHRQPL